MANQKFVIGLDVSTTGTKAMAVDLEGNILACALSKHVHVRGLPNGHRVISLTVLSKSVGRACALLWQQTLQDEDESGCLGIAPSRPFAPSELTLRDRSARCSYAALLLNPYKNYFFDVPTYILVEKCMLFGAHTFYYFITCHIIRSLFKVDLAPSCVLFSFFSHFYFTSKLKITPLRIIDSYVSRRHFSFPFY